MSATGGMGHKTTHLLHEAGLTHHTESRMGPERGVREIIYRYSDYRDVEGNLFPWAPDPGTGVQKLNAQARTS